MKTYFLIAKRFLFPRNNFRSNTINFISFVGLFIGSASIVLSISVLNGFQNILQTETKKLYGDYLIENLNNSEYVNYFEDSNFGNINLSTFYEDEFLIVAQSKQHIIKFKSVSNKSLDGFYKLNLQNNLEFLSEDEVIIGKSLSRRLNLDVGDYVQIISKDFKLNSLSLPEIYSFKVANIFSNRILKADNFLVFGINKEIFKGYDSFIEVNGNISEFKDQSFSFSSWEDRNRQLFEATEIEKKITFFTLLLIILVASFNLCSSVMQISSQKIRDLAIFYSIGMKKNDIKKIFIIYSYAIGLTALAGGILFALLLILLQSKFSIIKLSSEFYLVDTLPMQIYPADIFWLLTGSTLLIGIFTSIPLRFINNLSPMKIINKQL
jgi:lipoprotein-releasing system permease protein